MAATYGESMRPLDLDSLPLEPLHRADPDVMRFIVLNDITSRAEKISEPDDWTTQEREAYDNDDWQLFSRLRGYTESEIRDFEEWMELVGVLDRKYGQDFAQSLGMLLWDQTGN